MTGAQRMADIGRRMAERSRERMRRIVETTMLREIASPLAVSDGGRSEVPRLRFVVIGPPPRGISFDCGLPVVGDHAYFLRDRDSA